MRDNVHELLMCQSKTIKDVFLDPQEAAFQRQEAKIDLLRNEMKTEMEKLKEALIAEIIMNK
jgi:hypothetical protein